MVAPRMWILALLTVPLIVGVGIFLLPNAVSVTIEAESSPLQRYDDGAGHMPLLARFCVTNVSSRRVWFLGPREMPDYSLQQLINGQWDYHLSGSSVVPVSSTRVWTALASGESVSFSVGPVNERATELSVGLGFTNGMFAPTSIHWISGPSSKLVRRGDELLLEPIEGALQSGQLLPLTSGRR